MGFQPVKSDPYKAGLRRKPRRGRLWTAEQWRELCRQARRDDGTFDRKAYPLSDRCVEMIVEFNRMAEQ